MIHLTVAMPMGIDSVYFSFVQRLASQNKHICLDPPAQNPDAFDSLSMIAAMGNSAQHHFVIGYRYPPRYWKLLVDHAATVSLLTDVDGIVRQIEFIQRKRAQAGENRDIQSCLMAIRHALDSLLEMIAWILHEGSNSTRIMPPAVAFMSDPAMAFRRLENFYAQAAVPIVSSCWEAFANEADPLLSQVEPVSMDLRNAIQRHLILDDATPSRLEALGELFSQHI